MKRKPMSRQPKSEMAKTKAETWRLFSLFIRYRDALKTTGTLEELSLIHI